MLPCTSWVDSRCLFICPRLFSFGFMFCFCIFEISWNNQSSFRSLVFFIVSYSCGSEGRADIHQSADQYLFCLSSICSFILPSIISFSSLTRFFYLSLYIYIYITWLPFFHQLNWKYKNPQIPERKGNKNHIECSFLLVI